MKTGYIEKCAASRTLATIAGSTAHAEAFTRGLLQALGLTRAVKTSSIRRMRAKAARRAADA